MSANAADRPLAGRRCLVAGDDTPLCDALRAGLELAGAEVAAAATAATRADAERLAVDGRRQLGGAVDTLVACPPRLAAASIDELDPARFDGALDAAYKSPFRQTQALLGDLRHSGNGRIVYVTSAAGILGRAYTAHLAAGARAAIALMRTVAYEEAPAVTANAIAVGPMAGDALLGARARGLAEQRGTAADAAAAAVAERIPLGRLTEPEDVLQTLLWVLRPQSAFLTGELLTVAGASELQVWP
jgi:NAD(P)-dependent dehydrogenase (short-subunit alcohol dehydrogenase family)